LIELGSRCRSAPSPGPDLESRLTIAALELDEGQAAVSLASEPTHGHRVHPRPPLADDPRQRRCPRCNRCIPLRPVGNITDSHAQQIAYYNDVVEATDSYSYRYDAPPG
jgi:hypothetical protein